MSYCEDNNDVHYNPWSDPRIIAKFNVTSTSEATTIMYFTATSSFTEIEIDGVVQPSVVNTYTFDTTGEHTIKYTLADPTSISKRTFNGRNNIISITIPNSVTTIGEQSFRSCTGLTSITIPDSVTSIGNSAFDNCSGLTSITIPDSVTSIGQGAFFQCTGLTSVTIGNSVTTITGFSGCTGLTSITIPNSVTTITGFSGCTGLTSITIPNSVTTIGDYAFTGCSGITSITIPNSVTSIGDNAFNGCTSLTSITSLATTAPTIQSGTFQGVKTGGTLTVPTGSTGYDVWMGTGNYYLGKYGWTKVEQ